MKPLWPQRFPVRQLSFGSHQDWIFCTRNQIPVSKTSCTAGLHLLMAHLCCYTQCLVQDIEAKKGRRTRESEPTKETLKRKEKKNLKRRMWQLWKNSSGEQLQRIKNRDGRYNLRLTPLKFQSVSLINKVRLTTDGSCSQFTLCVLFSVLIHERTCCICAFKNRKPSQV